MTSNFTSNNALGGGAIRIEYQGDGAFTDCHFISNVAYNGGAVTIFAWNHCNFDGVPSHFKFCERRGWRNFVGDG